MVLRRRTHLSCGDHHVRTGVLATKNQRTFDIRRESNRRPGRIVDAHERCVTGRAVNEPDDVRPERAFDTHFETGPGNSADELLA